MAGQMKSLAQSWSVQQRVIAALLLREILTRYGRHNIGFLWLFVEPMIFTLGVAALWTATKAIHNSDLPIIAFAITGYSSVLLWRNMPLRCINAVHPNLSLLYHRNVKVLDIFLARVLLEAIGASMSFVVLSVFFIAIGEISPPENMMMVMWGWLMLCWFGMSMAILLGALNEETELIEKFWHPMSYILFPLSGAGFLVDALPADFQKFVLLLPMVHGVEYIREGYFGSKINAIHDLSYMALVNMVLTVLALAVTRKISRQVVPE